MNKYRYNILSYKYYLNNFHNKVQNPFIYGRERALALAYLLFQVDPDEKLRQLLA